MLDVHVFEFELEMNDPSTCMLQFVEREAHALDLLVDGASK
jgi:hypothetical protein